MGVVGQAIESSLDGPKVPVRVLEPVGAQSGDETGIHEASDLRPHVDDRVRETACGLLEARLEVAEGPQHPERPVGDEGELVVQLVAGMIEQRVEFDRVPRRSSVAGEQPV